RLVNVRGEAPKEQQPQVQEIAMNVLQDQGKTALTPVALARLADRAGGGIGPESLVVSPAIVVASDAETARRPEDKQGGREDQPGRPPERLPPEPAMV